MASQWSIRANVSLMIIRLCILGSKNMDTPIFSPTTGIGYRTAFETNESITFSRYGRPRSLRIPTYEHDTAALNSGSFKDRDDPFLGRVFVLVPSEARETANWLTQAAYCFKKDQVGEYVILHKITRPIPEGRKIPYSAKQIRFFIPPNNTSITELSENTQTLIDNDEQTRWGTSGIAQVAGTAVEIDFPETSTIQRILLNLGSYIPRRAP